MNIYREDLEARELESKGTALLLVLSLPFTVCVLVFLFLWSRLSEAKQFVQGKMIGVGISKESRLHLGNPIESN